MTFLPYAQIHRQSDTYRSKRRICPTELLVHMNEKKNKATNCNHTRRANSILKSITHTFKNLYILKEIFERHTTTSTIATITAAEAKSTTSK